MKRKIILGIVFCILGLLAITAAFVVHDAKVMHQGDNARAYISHIANMVELYRESHGAYPASMEELASKSDQDEKEFLKQELEEFSTLGLKANYQLQTNGFKIAVSGIDSWRPSLNTIEENFKKGEALHIFDAPAKDVK